MKRQDLDQVLRRAGWWLLRHGGRHDVWTNGEMTEAVPRHREIHERLAAKIVRKAERNPPKGE